MLIGTCGFGSTGSSAISDYLSEYGEDLVQVLDNIEFTWVSGVDGLIDLEYHLNHPHSVAVDSIVAIDRYLKRVEYSLREYRKYANIPEGKFRQSATDFINTITNVSWDWYIQEPQSFIKKGWTNYELDGIISKANTGEQVLLPVWHGITKQEGLDYSPSLADKVARNTASYTVEEIAEEIAELING